MAGHLAVAADAHDSVPAAPRLHDGGARHEHQDLLQLRRRGRADTAGHEDSQE